VVGRLKIGIFYFFKLFFYFFNCQQKNPHSNTNAVNDKPMPALSGGEKPSGGLEKGGGLNEEA